MSLFKEEPKSVQEQWYILIKQAIAARGYRFDDSIESYLMLTLEHFTRQNNLAHGVIALDLLNSLQLMGRQRSDQLRQVGDECLLLSGLFPERVHKKNVSLDYLIGMGQQAYSILGDHTSTATNNSELFNKLSQHFIGLMDVLHVMRHLSSTQNTRHFP